jgi:hypothetical protein
MVLSSSAYFIFLVAVFFLYWPVARFRALSPGNDKDTDLLVNAISIAPFTIFLDTTDPRNVCNVSGAPFGLIVNGQMYQGDSIFDGLADYGLEMDAYTFAAN